VQVLGLNGGQDSPSDLTIFRDAFQIDFPILIEAAIVYSQYNQPGGASPYPLDYIIDQQGNVAYFSDEYRPAAMVGKIDELLGNSPSIDASPGFLPFGAVPLGASAQLLLQLSNTGEGNLDIHHIATGSSEFSSNLSSLNIPPGANRSLLIDFAPATTGARIDTLWLASNDPEQPLLAMQLSGIGGDGTAADPPPADRLALGAEPNPFSARSSLSFTLPTQGRVWLEIFDVRGRRVRTLAEGEGLGAGLHARSWDGRDEEGRALAAGVYFARLRGGGRIMSRKLALLR
jgi:hypothetical protein